MEPLVYDFDEQGNKIPKLPEQILSLKVGDISCGSASFLVAALNYLTEALYQSLLVHAALADPNDYRRKTLPLGLKVETPPQESLLPCSPEDDNFEEKVKARLRRSVVEHCIYGVDLNPMAVELARLSLWIETMDKDLPFEFLDHKIKVGNSLVGAWLDTFQEYPLAAWLREGGDKSHVTNVHYKEGTWTKAIKDKFHNQIKPEMAQVIRLRSGQEQFSFMGEFVEPKGIHKELQEAYASLHDQASSFFGLEQKEKIYVKQILRNPHYLQLKDAMDLWCALWFWPADKLNEAPTPRTFYSPSKVSLAISRLISRSHRFFHWEIEFPDVFNAGRSGFDAIVGNPPWEINKPNSLEFFSDIDPMFRSYRKQLALENQKRYFEANEEFEKLWLTYCSIFKAMSSFIKYSALACGDPADSDENSISIMRGKENLLIHTIWRKLRQSRKLFLQPRKRYTLQGSADINTYKLFLESCYIMIKTNGRVGLIVPSGIYSDRGSRDLRKEFIKLSKWEWLFVFENREGIFDIHRSFKFNPTIIEKTSQTDSINTAFMRHDILEWENADNILKYDRRFIDKFSPYNFAIMEIENLKELDLLDKIYDKSVIAGEQKSTGWCIQYGTEFHMTSSSGLFRNRETLEKLNYNQDIYGRYISHSGEIALPLYQGLMIWLYDYSYKKWISGTGRNAKWVEIDWNNKIFGPQYLIMQNDYQNKANVFRGMKIAMRRVTTAVHKRTYISSLVPDFPCSDKAAIFGPSENIKQILFLAITNSFVFDFVIKRRCSYLQVDYHILEESPLPSYLKIPSNTQFIELIFGLAGNHFAFSPYWLKIRDSHPELTYKNWKAIWAISEGERIRRKAIIDAIIAETYDLNFNDFSWILKDDERDLKGFWRVDKDKPKELRHTTLALLAFKRLKEIGLEEFVKEDWQLPAEVQKAFGPRFYDWQLQGTPEESWAECEHHARQILGEEGYKQFIEGLEKEKKDALVVKEPSAEYYTKPGKDKNQLKLL